MQTTPSAAKVPMAAPVDFKNGINNKFITMFTPAPQKTDTTYILSLCNGIRYCVLSTLASAIKMVLGAKTAKILMHGS